MENKYRNIEFTEDDKFFNCSDTSLLKGVSTMFFQTKTLAEMKNRIDTFLDKRDHILELEELNGKAIHSTYKDNNFPLD